MFKDLISNPNSQDKVDIFIRNLIKWSIKNQYKIILGIVIIICLMILMEMINIIYNRRVLGTNVARINDNINHRFEAKISRRQRFNSLIQSIVKFKIRHGLYLINDIKKEEINFILERKHILDIERKRAIKYEEYEAIISLINIATIIVGIVVIIVFKKTILPVALLVIAIIVATRKFPIMYWAESIKYENAKIQEEFGDFYLTQHHILINEVRTPLTKGLNLYKKIARSDEMRNFVNEGLDYVRQEGEESAIVHLMRLYRDINDIQKLMRIEQQIMNGASDTTELIGIRRQIIQEKEDMIEERCEKTERIANIYIFILFIILFQVMAFSVTFLLYMGK